MMMKTRRGNAVLLVSLLSGMIGFGTFSVDVGLIWLAKVELQQAVDNAVLSGVGQLDGTEEGIERAEATALAIANAHKVLGDGVTFTDEEVKIGKFDDQGEFVAYEVGDDPFEIGAVQVEHAGEEVPAGLGGFAFGVSSYKVQARARAKRRIGAKRAREVNCYLPLAIPDCHLASLAPDTNPSAFTFTFSPSPTDAVAWSLPGSNPNSSDVRDQLLGQCEGEGIAIGDDVYVNEGSKTTALHTIRDVLNGSGAIAPTVWDVEMYGPMPEQGCLGTDGCDPSNSDVNGASWGNVIEGPVVLVDVGSDCGDASFTHTKEVTAVAWALIYDVSASGGDKYISVQLDLASEHLSWGMGQEGDEDGDVGDPTNVLVPSNPEMVGW